MADVSYVVVGPNRLPASERAHPSCMRLVSDLSNIRQFHFIRALLDGGAEGVVHVIVLIVHFGGVFAIWVEGTAVVPGR